jgi:murein DD-endopeptidase MepM/ murein hydrolase activator NlpD
MYAHSSGPGRATILIAAVIGLALIALLLSPSDGQTRLSGWRALDAASLSIAAGAEAPLRGAAVAQPSLHGRGLPGTLRPSGNPLGAPNTVMTQGYGVGTHAPAEIWGAVDLALDGTGDGRADPTGTWNQPVYATHYGVVKVTPNSYPAGNHVWVTNDAYRTGYAHLADFVVTNGQVVEAGDMIGYIGSTGMSSGPHLDYQVWEQRGGAWVNVNPLDYGALDPAP